MFSQCLKRRFIACKGRASLALWAFALLLPTPNLSGLTFDEAWALVRQEHGSLRAADLDRQRLERLDAATRGLLLPQINLEGRYTRLNDPVRIDLDPLLGLLPGLPAGLPPLGVTVQDEEYWKANISAVWPLYTGGRVSAARAAAGLEVEAAEEQFRRTLNEIHSDLARRYFAVSLAEQVLTAREAALEGSKQHLRHALRLEEEGLISYAERLHAEVAQAEADRASRHATRQLEMAQKVLGLFLNLDESPTTDTPLPKPRFDLVADGFEWRARAKRDHPILGALEANRGLAAEGSRAERGRLLPEVFAFGRRELVSSDLTILEPEWAVGIGLNWALLDRTDRVNRLRAARLRERQVEALAEQVERDLETLVESRLLEVKQAVEQFDTLERMLSLARENLRVRESAFAEGLATSLEVVDARIGLAQVETARAAARFQFTVQYALLHEAAGGVETFNRIFSPTANASPHP